MPTAPVSRPRRPTAQEDRSASRLRVLTVRVKYARIARCWCESSTRKTPAVMTQPTRLSLSLSLSLSLTLSLRPPLLSRSRSLALSLTRARALSLALSRALFRSTCPAARLSDEEGAPGDEKPDDEATRRFREVAMTRMREFSRSQLHMCVYIKHRTLRRASCCRASGISPYVCMYACMHVCMYE